MKKRVTQDPYVYSNVFGTRSLVTQGSFGQILLGGDMPDAEEQQTLSTTLSNMLTEPPVFQGVEEYPIP